MKPSIWFWVVGGIALLFNGYGGFDYIMTTTGGEDYLTAAGFTAEQITYWVEMPAWRTALWALGVWSGVIAAILMLLRKAWAVPLFAIGPVVFVLNLLAAFADGGVALLGSGYVVMSLVILAIIVFIWWYARKQKAAGILS